MSQPGDPPDLASRWPDPPPGSHAPPPGSPGPEQALVWTGPQAVPPVLGSMGQFGLVGQDRPDRLRTAAVSALVVAAAVAALGAPFGLLWSALAPDVPQWMSERGPVYADPQPEQLIAADGWFALLAVPFGILLAVGVWLAARRIRGLPAMTGLVAGAVGAGLLAWWVGRQIGLAGYRETVAGAEVGARLERPPDLTAVEVGWLPPHVFGVLLVPALAATITYTLLAAWSAYPTLRSDDPYPEQSFGDLGVS